MVDWLLSICHGRMAMWRSVFLSDGKSFDPEGSFLKNMGRFC